MALETMKKDEETNSEVVAAPAGTIMGESNGGYEVLKPVGKGKFAVVYRARRISDNEIVALKRVKCDQMDEKQRAKALKEVKLVQSLHHPNIVQYLDSWYEGNELVIALEFVAAGDLKRQLRKANEKMEHFDERIIWNYFSQIAEAIKYMHEQRIMHRDLKPANIFLTLSGQVKVGDLGLGRQLSEQTLQGGGQVHSKVGTPLYMSPEVLHGDGYDFSSDVWSVGCLLYELAMLKSPFKSEGLNLYKLFQKISRGDYQPLPNQYSKELVELAYAMLNLDPKLRPSLEEVTEVASHYKDMMNAGVRPRLDDEEGRPYFGDTEFAYIKNDYEENRDKTYIAENKDKSNNSQSQQRIESKESEAKPHADSEINVEGGGVAMNGHRVEYISRNSSLKEQNDEGVDGDDEDEEAPAPPPLRPMSHRKQLKNSPQTTNASAPYKEWPKEDVTPYATHRKQFDKSSEIASNVDNSRERNMDRKQSSGENEVSRTVSRPSATSSQREETSTFPSANPSNNKRDAIKGSDVMYMELLWHKLDILGYFKYRKGFRETVVSPSNPLEALLSPRAPKVLPPLLVTHFSFPSELSRPWIASSHQQFLDFVHAAHWLLDKLNLAKDYFDFGDDNAEMITPHIVARALLVALGAAGFPPDMAQRINPTALAAGYGEAPIQVLLFLADKILETCPPEGLFEPLQYPATTPFDDEDGIDDEDEIEDVEVELEESEQDFVGFHQAKQEDMSDHKDMIWSPIDDQSWLEELERVRGRLVSGINLMDSDISWRHRVDTARVHTAVLSRMSSISGESQDKIKLQSSSKSEGKSELCRVKDLGLRLKEMCETTRKKEASLIPQVVLGEPKISHGTSSLENICAEHKIRLVHSQEMEVKLQELRTKLASKMEKLSSFTDSLNEMESELEVHGESATNTEPLRLMKAAGPRLVNEINKMNVNEGVLSQQLLRHMISHPSSKEEKAGKTEHEISSSLGSDSHVDDIY